MKLIIMEIFVQFICDESVLEKLPDRGNYTRDNHETGGKKNNSGRTRLVM